MPTISYAEARERLGELMDRVCAEGDPVKVTRDGAPPVVVMSLDRYYSIDETAFLLSNPANEAALREALEQDRRGETVSFRSVEEAMAAALKAVQKAS